MANDHAVVDNRRLLPDMLAAFKANLIPGVCLWVLALVVLGLYYGVEATRPAFEWVAELKADTGFVFSAVGTAFFGGFIPWLVTYLGGAVPKGQGLKQLLFFVILFGYRGVEVDTVYRTQSYLWGDGTDAATLAIKVACDQFIYTAIWALPTAAILFGWKDAEFRWSGITHTLRDRFFTYRAPIMVMSAWVIWIPTVTVVYSLPPTLQIPLFNLVLCFAVLVMNVLSLRAKK